MRGRAHGRRQLRQRGQRPLRYRLLRAQRHAHLAGVTVDQPAQRRGRVGVLRRDRRLHRLHRHVALECHVSGTPQHRGAGGQHRHVPIVARVQRADEAGVVEPVRPGDVQRPRGDAQALQRVRVGLGQGAQQAHLRLHHQPRRGHAGQQRNLFVPVLDRQARAERQAPAAVDHVDFLLGQRQADAATIALALGAQLADPAQHVPHRVALACIDVALHAGVVELGAAAHAGAPHVDGGDLAAAIQFDRPQQRRSHLVGQQRGGILGQHFGVQRDLAVRPVQRFAAPVCLAIDRIASLHEGGDVGDGVMHQETLAVLLHMHRLIEIARVRRIDGDQRQRGAIQRGQARICRSRRGRRFHLGGERERQVHLAPDVGHALRKHGVARGLQADAARGRHDGSRGGGLTNIHGARRDFPRRRGRCRKLQAHRPDHP